MKILQVLPKLNVGGVERGVIDLAKYYKNKDDEIIVVSGGGRLVKELEELGAKHYTLNVFKKSILSLLSISKLRNIIKSENVDIVHARSRVPGWIAFFATRGTNAEFVTTAHGLYSVHFFSKVMAWGKVVICPSNVMARHMKNNFGVANDKISIIHRWVDLDKFKLVPFHSKPPKVLIVSVGRISPSKGYEYLIEAMRQVVRLNPYANLEIIGGADDSKQKYLSKLKTLVSRYSLDYNIKFLGHRSDVGGVLASAHMLVMPSVVEESFGRVIIEAFASGVPVIATQVGAIPEIIEDRKDGMIVVPRDPTALSGAIIELLKNPKIGEALSLEARKKVEEKYSLEFCASQIDSIYKATKNFKKIMVIKISSLGDIILIIPALKAIKKQFPNSSLTLLVLKKYSSLLHDCPYIDKIIGIDEDYKKLNNILELVKSLRNMGFDYVIDFQNNRASHLISFLSFPLKTFGFSRKLGFLLNVKAKFPKSRDVDPLSSQERILNLLGIAYNDKKLEFWPIQDHDIPSALKSGKFIGINMSASSKWETKNWPIEHVKRLISIIAKEIPDFKVVLIGDKDSVSRALKIEESSKIKVINLSGKTSLRDLTGVIKRLSIFITPDTATLHLAQSLNVATIALFGPTNPASHTLKSDNLFVLNKNLDCSFCYKSKCKTCECMNQIFPSDVFAIIKKIIS